jgi:hypothetical protein
MDTKHLEQIGETFISHKLLYANILVAKPLFDRLGADLIGFTSIDDKARFCRIQCKYREIKKTTSVKIHSKYVVGAFVTFLYIRYDSKKYLYCFLPKDIQDIFKCKDNIFCLTITRKIITFLNSKMTIRFTKKKISAIIKLMKLSSPDAEIRRIASDIIVKAKKIIELQKKQYELANLVNEIKLLELEQKEDNEKLKILKEYMTFMKKHIKTTRKEEKKE